MGPRACITKFAPPERASDEQVEREVSLLATFEQVQGFLDAVPDIVTVLNRERQIVLANRPLVNLLGLPDERSLFGRRPGEVLGCIHSGEEMAGCGTTEFCGACGAVAAILSAQQGQADTRECRITRNGGDALDLRVSATPLMVKGEPFTIFTAVNTADENRRRVLERIFFHDVMNTAGNISAYAELLTDVPSEDMPKHKDTLCTLAGFLVDEIRSQQQLMAAESNELRPEAEPVELLALLRAVCDAYESHAGMYGCTLRVSPDAQTVSMITDRTLLLRVVGNLTKNAVEASRSGDVVTLNCLERGEEAVITVHNPAIMPRDVQLQMFQRSFSTKGTGRGLGTYSVKLLTDRYLGGRVSFESTSEAGTTFTAAYPLEFAPAES
jgi:signal transduction histidine kinase